MGDNLWCRLSLIEDPIDRSRHRGVVLSRDPEGFDRPTKHNVPANKKVSPVVRQLLGTMFRPPKVSASLRQLPWTVSTR